MLSSLMTIRRWTGGAGRTLRTRGGEEAEQVSHWFGLALPPRSTTCTCRHASLPTSLSRWSCWRPRRRRRGTDTTHRSSGGRLQASFARGKNREDRGGIDIFSILIFAKQPFSNIFFKTLLVRDYIVRCRYAIITTEQHTCKGEKNVVQYYVRLRPKLDSLYVYCRTHLFFFNKLTQDSVYFID